MHASMGKDQSPSCLSESNKLIQLNAFINHKVVTLFLLETKSNSKKSQIFFLSLFKTAIKFAKKDITSQL